MAERIDTEIDLSDKDDDKKKKIVAGEDDDRSSSMADDDPLDIEIEDDTPEQDRGRPQKAPGTKSAIPGDDEIGQYTKNVQDRMKQMRWEYHEERRAKEAWERQSSAAVEYAKKVYAENKKLRDLVSKGHKTLLDSTKGAAESEMAALQESLKAALETGNTTAAAELQAKLSRAAARAEAQNHIAPITFDDEGGEFDKTQKEQPTQQRPRISRAMQEWMEENPWFNQNKRMTAFAFGVHEELLGKGIPPESPRYFKEINKAMKDTFSNYFEGDDDEENSDGRTDRRSTNARQASRRTNVAGVSRNTAAKGNKVTLTSSEMMVAKRMGITPEAYAREKIRLEQQDNG